MSLNLPRIAELLALDRERTQGDWTRVPQNQGGDLIAHPFETGNQMNPKGLRLIAFMMLRGNSIKEDEANADFIISAPELAEQLRLAVAEVERLEAWNDTLQAELDDRDVMRARGLSK